MTRQTILSSLIAEAGYDEKESAMEVMFHGGAVWRYYSVPEHKWKAFLEAKSKGQFFIGKIREATLKNGTKIHFARPMVQGVAQTQTLTTADTPVYLALQKYRKALKETKPRSAGLTLQTLLWAACGREQDATANGKRYSTAKALLDECGGMDLEATRRAIQLAAERKL